MKTYIINRFKISKKFKKVLSRFFKNKPDNNKQRGVK